jgi:alpha-L-rhamnosidase
MDHWICTKEFEQLEPINLFHKEMEPGAVYSHPNNLRNKHVLFRKRFTIQDKTEAYLLHITADDYYKLYINGIFIGQGPAPSYHFSYNVNVYDITGYLTEGENIIAVHCYYQGLVNRVWNSGDLRQGLYVQLIAGNQTLLRTDESWKYAYDSSFSAAGIPLGYETQYTENIDARKQLKGWTGMEYDDSAWQNACLKKYDDHILTEQITPPLYVYEAKPVLIKQMEEGAYLLDFGKEIVGGIKFKGRGSRGSTVRILCGEELQDNGHVRYDMRCSVCYDETWILSGEMDNIENYDYKGFRYVELIIEDDLVKPEQFSAVIRHYPVKNMAVFQSSNPLLNNIWDICANGVIMGSQEGFLDCPQREKGQYLGDMTVTALSHTYLTGDHKLYRKALMDFADSTFICKGMMAVAPGSFMQEIADFSLLYPLQLLHYYHLTGDADFVKDLLPIAEGVVDYFQRYERQDGLLENVTDKWNLVDWPENLRDGYDFPLTKPIGKGCHNVLNAYYYGARDSFNQLLKAFGMKEKYDNKRLKSSFFRAFYNQKTGLFIDSEESDHSALHSNVLPLFFRMVEEDASDKIISFINERGLNCGVFFSYFVLKALARYGSYDLVYQFIINQSEHSWANMLREGATSCFEAWDKDQKWNTSLCHPWASSPIILIIEDLLGIHMERGEIKEINPHLPEGLMVSINLIINNHALSQKF